MTAYDPNTNDPKYGSQTPSGPAPAGKCDGCGSRLYPLPGESVDEMPERCASCQ